MTKIIKGVLAIIYDPQAKEFLLMKKKGTWVGWQFVQGGIEKGEDEEKAVKREIEEETGIKEVFGIKKLSQQSEYWFKWEGEKIHKFLNFYFANAKKTSDIKISKEHSGFKWCKVAEAKESIKFNKERFEKIVEEMKLE